MLTEEEIKKIDHEISMVPHKKAACIEALKVVQESRRWVSDEALSDVAKYLDMSNEEMDSVATFYNMIFRKKVGRHVILVCDSISCYVMGCNKIYEALQKELKVKYGATTEDNRFTLLPNACLGCCDHAPAVMVDDDLFLDVKPGKISEILDKYE